MKRDLGHKEPLILPHRQHLTNADFHDNGATFEELELFVFVEFQFNSINVTFYSVLQLHTLIL